MKTRKHLIFSCVTVIALFFPAAFWAATPQIDSLDGNYIDGQDITINGSWAPDGDDTPLLWDNFESGRLGSTLSTTPQRGSWSFNSTPTPTVYSNNYSHSGEQSAYTATTATGRGNVAVSGLETMDKIYWSFWFRYNDGGASGEQTKLFQLWGNGWNVSGFCDYGPGVMSGGFSDGWFATYNIASGRNCDTGRVQANYGFSPSMDNWHFGEMILQRSSNYGVSDGTVVVRIDNRTVYNQAGTLLTRMNGEDWQLAKFFYGFTNDGGKGNFSIDDAYMNDSWSRVVLGDQQSYSNCTELNIQPVTVWTGTAITFTANQGSFKSGDQAYLFVVDSSGQVSSGFPVTIGQGGSDGPPRLAITAPSSSGSYSMETVNDLEEIMLGGTASDDVLVESVSYSTDNGQSGIADTTDGYASWSALITVNRDETVVATVTATDSAGKTTSSAITITVLGADVGGPNSVGWDANVQTGDSTWSDSSVTYCVRLLVEGDYIKSSATQVALAFQGRSSGSYTIRNVSIAERDLAGGEGDVIDSTWTQVFFNGAAWNSNATVTAGSETISDPLNLKLNPGTDYYVTFKLEAPSVYLDPPSGYRELIFYSEDRTRDIDWGGNGHDVMQDYHALSKIYVIDATNAPQTPSLEMAP